MIPPWLGVDTQSNDVVILSTSERLRFYHSAHA